jgi:hypothetical protein
MAIGHVSSPIPYIDWCTEIKPWVKQRLHIYHGKKTLTFLKVAFNHG